MFGDGGRKDGLRWRGLRSCLVFGVTVERVRFWRLKKRLRVVRSVASTPVLVARSKILPMKTRAK